MGTLTPADRAAAALLDDIAERIHLMQRFPRNLGDFETELRRIKSDIVGIDLLAPHLEDEQS